MGEPQLKNSTLISRRHCSKKKNFFKRMAAYAAAAFFTISPLTSLANKTPASKPAISEISAKYMVDGTRLQISDGKENPWVYAISKQAQMIPSIKLKGPAVLEVKFYPAVKKARFDIEAEVKSSLKYSINTEGEKKETKTHVVNVEKSNFKSDVVDTKLAIAEPIRKSMFFPKGDHEFSAIAPNGFLEVVSVKKVVEEKKKIHKPIIKKPKFKPLKKQIRAVPKKEELAHFRSFEFFGERVHLHALGPQENNGDMNQIQASVNIPLGHLIALNTGINASSFGLIQDSADANTDLRSASANALIGIALNKGRHTAFVRALAGYRLMRRHISSKEGKGTDLENTHSYELGGQVGYSFDHAIEVLFSGSNNPFNPISAKVNGSLPWGWVEGKHPSLELDVLWLHTLSNYPEPGRVGGIKLNEKNLFAHAGSDIPIWAIGPVIPSLLVCGDFNASEKGFHQADFLVGGALSLELKKLLIEAGAAVSPLTKTPFFKLKILYK